MDMPDSLKVKKEKIKSLDTKGIKLEKEKKVKNWSKYNTDLNKLTKDYTDSVTEYREIVSNKVYDDAGAELVDRTYHEMKKSGRVYSVPDLSFIKKD